VPKILYVLHSHPANSIGGVEINAYALYEAIRKAGAFDPTLVGRTGKPRTVDWTHHDTRFAIAGNDPNQYYFHTELDEFDKVLGTARDKRLYTEDWRTFLAELKPDIVHFRHTLWLGYDLIRETRNTLPDVPLVYSFHDFISICHHGGQMVRTNSHELCDTASPQRCHECFPAISAQKFFLRERFIKSALELVDLFIAPSRHLRQRYVEWGIPPDKIRYEDTGLLMVEPLPDPPDAGRRRRIGYFGQIGRFKGVDVLLEAMKILEQEEAGVQLLVHGGNLEYQTAEFQQKLARLQEQAIGSVSFTGRYDHSELPGLLSDVDWVVVPSISWEVGPNSIREAMMHRRPIICSDIGAMAERVRDGVNGLHFHVGDSRNLADAIRRATGDPTLWDELRAGLRDPHAMGEHLAAMTAIYEELLSDARQRR
jgi:glycosyltransferase involved in cell wall biosynthesis